VHCQYLIPLSSSLCNAIYTQNNIVRGLVGGDNNIFVMERDRYLATFGSLKIDVERVLIDPLSFLIPICMSNLTLFIHS
jgi:hypothetical protein